MIGLIDKAKYIVSNGNHCPKCKSNNIEGREYDSDDPVTQKIICLACNEEWRDVLTVSDVLDGEGSPTFPAVFPLNQIFGWSWIVTCPGCTEYDWHGPFETEPHKFWEAAKKVWLAMREDYDGPIHEVRFDPSTGRLVSTELTFEEDEETESEDTET